MKAIKKIFHIEYDLTSDEFKEQKQDEISAEYQSMYPNYICKVITFCVPDNQILISTTEESRILLGAASKLLANRPLADQSFLNMDANMLQTYEMSLSANNSIPDYSTAINMAQSKAEWMLKFDDSKIPLVTVIDYKWGNSPAIVTAKIFSSVDEKGNKVSLIGNGKVNVVVGNDNNVDAEVPNIPTNTELTDIKSDLPIHIFKNKYFTNSGLQFELIDGLYDMPQGRRAYIFSNNHTIEWIASENAKFTLYIDGVDISTIDNNNIPSLIDDDYIITLQSHPFYYKKTYWDLMPKDSVKVYLENIN